jgi:hypothetical protein
MLQTIIKKTLRVPALASEQVNGECIARQLDVALMAVGFKLSRELLEHFSTQQTEKVIEQGKATLAAVKQLVGDHVQHNVYFIDFPDNVPNTLDFWWREFFRLFLTGQTKYGRYQHSYEEMLIAHDEFISSAQDRVTILHLGKSLPEETLALYHQLASSAIPLNEADRALVKELAEICLHDEQPETIPIRETKAVINAVRIQHAQPIFVDTVTDILRLACALSNGDVTLQEKTKFCSFSRSIRRMILHALDDIIHTSPAQLADIHRYQERWKRLGERLHPHEYADKYAHAAQVFAVARGEKKVPTLESQVEAAFQLGDISRAISILTSKPGLLVRNVDRISRNTEGSEMLVGALLCILPRVSGRVLLGLREHLQNRLVSHSSRVFTNSKGRAWVTEDKLQPLDARQVNVLSYLLDDEITRRLPHIEHLVVDHDVLRVALPLSDKNKADGFGVLPRGSIMEVGNGILRFFVYWKQVSQRTDYDLSAILLSEQFEHMGQLSWTKLSLYGGVHSGDLTDATNGATEFIDIDLSQVDASYIVPSINIYAGEDFKEVESCFFGFMQRTLAQKGKPFEARTVRFKSDMRGNGRVALPLIFKKDKDQWIAKWMHLYLKGQPKFNQVEANHLSTGMLTSSILSRDYLNMEYLINLLRRKANTFSWHEQGTRLVEQVTFIGLEAPERLHKDSKIYTLNSLQSLFPA